jgi:uncharacterized protein YgiM (DUF1202 family)
MIVSFGSAIEASVLVDKLKSMQIPKIDLWIVENANADTIQSVCSVSAAVGVKSAWITQSKDKLPDFQYLSGKLTESGIQVHAAVSGDQYSIGKAKASVLINTMGDSAVHLEYDSAGFEFFSSPGALNDPSLAKGTDVWYIGNSTNGSVDKTGSLRPAFAVLDSVDTADTAVQKLTGLLTGNGIPMLTPGSAFSFASDGTLIRLVNANAFGAIRKAKVNIREKPSTDSKRIAGISKNALVVITGSTTQAGGDLWYMIDLNGQTGYIRGDLITPVTIEKAQQLSKQNNSSGAKKTPKPVVDTVSGSTKKGH